MTNLEPGFFEFIGIADAERIHSEMISWMLSANSPLDTIQEKNRFLGALLEGKFDYKKINAVTEFKSVDIMIVADNAVFIIENKLKSSEHSGQTTTDRYENNIKNAIQKKAGLFDRNETIVGKYYLTLIAEEAAGSGWKNISYQRIHEAFKGISDRVSPEYSPQINEYIKTLTRLLSVVGEFGKNHQLFKNVFLDGGKSKWEKLALMGKYETDSQRYIAMCQLETILQKLFLRNIARDLEWVPCEISETRGQALLQHHIGFPSIYIDENEFRFGFQIQGRAVKLNLCSLNCSKSKKEDIESVINNIIEPYVCRRKSQGKKTFTKLNKPKSKAYVSLSCRLDKDIFKHSFERLCDIYGEYYEEACGIVAEIVQETERKIS